MLRENRKKNPTIAFDRTRVFSTYKSNDDETKDKTNNFIAKKLFKLNKHRRVICTELHKVGCVNPPKCDELRLFKSL